MNALQGGSVGDISLDAIAVMAQATGEYKPKGSAVRTEIDGVATQVFEDDNGHKWERVCDTKQVVCRGEGSIQCTESFSYQNCSKWREVF